MGIAGADGFGSALCGADVEDAGENKTIKIKMVRLGTVMLMPTTEKTTNLLTEYLCRRAEAEGGCHRNNG